MQFSYFMFSLKSFIIIFHVEHAVHKPFLFSLSTPLNVNAFQIYLIICSALRTLFMSNVNAFEIYLVLNPLKKRNLPRNLLLKHY